MTKPSAPDPFASRRAELVGHLAFGDWSDAESEWYDAHSQLEELHVAEDGKLAIRFNGPPREYAEVDACPDCGRVIFSSGIWFGEPLASEYSIGVHLHWSEECPAWKHRAWRIWYVHAREMWIWVRHPVKKYRWWKMEQGVYI